jgi:hypothetical protein
MTVYFCIKFTPTSGVSTQHGVGANHCVALPGNVLRPAAVALRLDESHVYA